MQKVNGWPVNDFAGRAPENHGKPWTDGHIDLAEDRLRSGQTVALVAQTLGRQPSAVISKLEKLGVIRSNDCGASYHFSFNQPKPEVIYHKTQGCTWKEAKEYAAAEKETIMTNHVFETKTFIDGKDVATYSVESLLNMADKVVSRMKKLEAISEAYGAASADPSTTVLSALQAEYGKCKDNLVKIMDLAAEKLNATDGTAE